MANIQSREYHMYQSGDRYTFLYRDEHMTTEIRGSIREIAFAIYKDWVGQSTDGYGVTAGNFGYGPFFLEEKKETGVWEVILLIDTIKPEPEQQFWDELNRYVNHFFNTLTAFI